MVVNKYLITIVGEKHNPAEIKKAISQILKPKDELMVWCEKEGLEKETKE